MLPWLAAASLITAGCSDDSAGATGPSASEKIARVPVKETWAVPGLSGPVDVIRTEANIPHIYASNRKDLAFVQGFETARDRYFMLDLSRRLGLGKLSELLGDKALPNDQESRANGQAFVADQIVASMSKELLEHVDAYAAGVNEYIAQVKAGKLSAPTEIDLAGSFLTSGDPLELMKPFDRRDVAGMMSVVFYQSSFESGDVGRAAEVAQLASAFSGVAFENLRKAGALDDLYAHIEPVKNDSSAAGFFLETASSSAGSSPMSAVTLHAGAGPVHHAMLQRLATRLAKDPITRRRDRDAGFGSNAWAVSGKGTVDGGGLLSGDGHLSLAVPSIFYEQGLDTAALGGGDVHQVGLVIPGFPVLLAGTNGRIAWSSTQLSGDGTDWYREQIRLDDQGAPKESLFAGTYRPLKSFDEKFVIADVPLLQSKGRTETWKRYTTFDGRWIADIEGRAATADEVLAPGETLLNLGGNFVVPGDQDGDGVISAVSFVYYGFFAGAVPNTYDALSRTSSIDEFRDATRGLIASSQNYAAADDQGNILYSSYQGTPCRGYLERDAQGAWVNGADPNLLLDGTKYGAFKIPVKEGKVDESVGVSDPYACVVPFDKMPAAINPAKGYVFTANNDPGNIATDSTFANDPYYIGGPWDIGYRAHTISSSLAEVVSQRAGDLEHMASIQGDHVSQMGGQFGATLVAAISRAKQLSATGPDPATSEGRMAALYAQDSDALDEVSARVSTWLTGGHVARSGVETFYQTVSDADRTDAVATMLFNAWLGRFMRRVFDDEPVPGVVFQGGSQGRVRALIRILEGRGPNNPRGLSSYNPETQESVFFDVVGTDVVETSDELVVSAMVEALAFLRSDTSAEGEGGFGTSDMNEYLWGLRHKVKFQSLLADFLGSSDQFSFLTDSLEINTSTLPLADGLKSDDPRSDLRWFPRDGDNLNVDAANAGYNGEEFTYGSGPCMRMVISLKAGQVKAQNVTPGGQSALTDSAFFADQTKLWLGNQTRPMRWSLDDVIEGATGRERFNSQLSADFLYSGVFFELQIDT
ncbi:MAG: penicillin acylase family protein [Polyangiaceae bacterium]